MNLGWKCAPPVFFEDPPTAVAGAAAPPAPPAVQPGPWAADLDAYFGDNAEAKAVADRYLREKVQPRMTQLEQSGVEHTAAINLYEALHENPEATLADVVAHFYGEERPEVVEKFADVFAAEEAAAAAAEAAPAADDVPEWGKPLLAREQAAVDEELRASEAAAYDEFLGELRTAHPDLTDADMKIIHPFVAGAAGDADAVYNGLQEWRRAAGVAAVVREENPPPVLPPVLGGEGSAAAAPPVQKEYANIDEAMDDWFAERRAQAPPPVI